MEQLLRDLRFGARQLLKHPLFTLIAAVALGLGIGSVTTQLTVINAVFLKGLPYPEASRIAHLERTNIKSKNYSAEPPILEFIEWRDRQEAFDGLAGYYNGTANLTFDNYVERYSGSFISANAFQLLGVKAFLGRTLEPRDDLPESPEVVVLSHRVWKRDFGSDPAIVGRSAILNGRSATIIGVMPEGFGFPINEDLWVPLFKQKVPSRLNWGELSMTLEVFGRLKRGVSFEEATASMGSVAIAIQQDHPDTQEGFSAIEVKPFLDEFTDGQTVTMVSVMMLITALILLIACANVANLLLARSVRRQKEIAIRSALGATRHRILAQFLTESVLLSTLGALLGIVLAWNNVRNIQASSVELETPSWMAFELDGRILLAVIFITLATGIVSGLIPAWRASKMDQATVLKDDSRTSTSLHMGRFSRLLVILQISIAAVVLTLVVLFVKSTNNAMSLDYEYNPDAVMTARIGLFEETYPEPGDRSRFIDQLLDRLKAHPEITVAASTSRYRFLGGAGTRYEISGNEPAEENRIVRIQQISPEFFDAVQLPILQGRGFNPEDFSAAVQRYAIVNTAFAQREWGHTNPIGQRFRADTGLAGLESLEEAPWLEVVGVVGGMQESGVFDSKDDGAAFYVPKSAESFPNFITILVRGSGDPENFVPILREEVSALDGNLPIYSVGTPRQHNDSMTAQFRFFASIFSGFGVLATFLAAVGIYGVITFSVDQRIMEFGIRQALGATRRAIFSLVYRHAMGQLSVGFIIALALLSPVILSPGIKASMSLFFYDIDPESVVPYLLSFGFVALIAILSAAPPAFRAARIHPAQALRYE